MSQRQAAVPFIFITILLDALGIGLLIPVMPEVIRRFNADPAFVNANFGYFIAIYAFMQFIASPLLGSLSDRFGRRPVLLVSLLGAGLDYILMAFAPSLTLLFLGRIFSGLTGASHTVAGSYMADISDDSNRSANFGMIGAGFGVGFILGPGLGGLLGGFGPQAPFLAAAALTLLNFAFGYFVLPESLPPEKRRSLDIARLNPLISLQKLFRKGPALTLIWAYFLMYLAGQSHPSIWTLYTEYKFGWTSTQVGLSLSFVGLSIGLAQGYLPRIVVPKIGEPRALRYGLLVYVIGFALFGLATQGWMMYAIMAFFALSGMAGPALQSMISRDVPSSEQGELQGSLIALASLTAIIGPLLYTGLFARFSSTEASLHQPGAPYLAASLICLLSLLLVRNVRGQS